MASELAIVLFPIIASSTVQLMFNPEYTGTPTRIQPPGWVFGVVWSIIYVLYGLYLQRISKHKNHRIVVIAWINLVLNLAWSPLVFVYKQRVVGLYVIHALIATLITMLTLLRDDTSKLLLMPYLTWLIIASQLQLCDILQNTD